MPVSATNTSSRPGKIVLYFLLAWTALNLIQACTLELQGDEAYYWLYSRYLDWGYFDHPPMVALFIRAGYAIMHNELGVRLFTVLASSLTVWLLWRIVKKYTTDAVTFVLVIAGIFIFHIYGFTITPDVPLFLFTVLFYYIYQRYIERDSIGLALVLAVVIAALFYSKYNAVLVIVFTLLANLSLLKRWSFWLIVVIAVALFMPHILWQVHHGYPSINYHLFERSAHRYDFTNTFGYIPGQLLMAGPLIGWFLFYKAFTTKIKDAFLRTLLVNCIGTFIFFFISSSKGEVQPHWTFILFAPLVILFMVALKQKKGRPRWFLPLAAVNISLIVIVRFIIIFGFGFARTYGHLKSYYGFKDWALDVKKRAGNNYVVMSEGFQNPSKYDFYTNSLKCFAYDTRYYRRTQFDIWPMEDSIQHKRVYYLTWYPVKGLSTDSLNVEAGKWYGAWVNDVRTYQKINFETNSYKIAAMPGQKITFNLSFTNPYPYPISFTDKDYLHPAFLEACFFSGPDVVNTQQADGDFKQLSIKPGQAARYTFTVTAPQKKGSYDLVFSLRTEPFPGSKNSRIITFTVN